MILTELITIEMFAERMAISRATAYDWKQRGILVQGKHFIKYGRIVRICWNSDLIEYLLAGCTVELPPVHARVHERKESSKSVVGTQINWEYE
ncbi:hypothetical protein GMPD_38190 [Geomonas paludis]|uniref:Helix-turn-helix domain-containing protein n=1 Tax=Geomonas paludis TaxID=2740185 RepID=A0A6V8N0L5_9BACT|nr:hypothetical protein GMPD_38190 [Geomonas paludis]